MLPGIQATAAIREDRIRAVGRWVRASLRSMKCGSASRNCRTHDSASVDEASDDTVNEIHLQTDLLGNHNPCKRKYKDCETVPGVSSMHLAWRMLCHSLALYMKMVVF